MKIGFVVNDLKTEQDNYTTVHLGLSAVNQGHEAWFMGVGDFAYDPDGSFAARARSASKKAHRDAASFLADIRSSKGRHKRIAISSLDVLMLRNDPAADFETPWAQSAGFIFGQLADREGVLVLNDPTSLADAFNKMYFQHFPEAVRPRTLITRDFDEIRKFTQQEKGRVVLKPLQGSGGASVFVLRNGGEANLRQITEAITRDGYVIVQEYLPAAKNGDVRMFVMNGQPLTVNGKVAAFRRSPAKGEARSNISVGGKPEAIKITDSMMRIVETVRPKLIRDGMFLVGLDIVGDKLMEINVFSPGGLQNAGRLEGEDFSAAVIEAIGKKVEYRKHYGMTIGNKRLATI